MTSRNRIIRVWALPPWISINDTPVSGCQQILPLHQGAESSSQRSGQSRVRGRIYIFFLFINKTEVAYDSVEDRSAGRIRERTMYVQSAANIGLVCSGIHKVSFPVIDVTFPRRCGRESEN